MKTMEFRSGLVDGKDLRELQRPLELDLEAAFKAARDDCMRALAKAVHAGATPDEAIRAVDAVLAED